MTTKFSTITSGKFSRNFDAFWLEFQSENSQLIPLYKKFFTGSGSIVSYQLATRRRMQTLGRPIILIESDDYRIL